MAISNKTIARIIVCCILIIAYIAQFGLESFKTYLAREVIIKKWVYPSSDMKPPGKIVIPLV